MKIKYLVCYDTEINKQQSRAYTLSAATVIDSVLDALKEIECEVELISFSSTTGQQSVPATCYPTKHGFSLRLFWSFGRKNIFTRLLNSFAMRMQYFFYLLFTIQKDDVVIAYHSPYLINMLLLLKKVRRFQLVLQMLEIYADVANKPSFRKKELVLANASDAFIFPTETLDRIVNTQKKPSVIMLGTYSVEADRNVSFNDDKIHVLYAGTLDPRKGGAAAAAAAAEFLPSNYHIHILGFGSDQEKELISKTIKDSQKPGYATVTYDGLLAGEEYIRFVQSCDIGLSTQNPDAAFNATSFPSKILSYLANGLHVVSIDIDPVKSSAVGDLITYYSEQSAESIAKAIQSVDFNKKTHGRILLSELKNKLKSELKTLFYF